MESAYISFDMHVSVLELLKFPHLYDLISISHGQEKYTVQRNDLQFSALHIINTMAAAGLKMQGVPFTNMV